MTVIQSALRPLAVLNLLLPHFVEGLSPGEIVKETGFAFPVVSHAIDTLVETGFADRIEGSNRVRPSMRLGRAAVGIFHSIDHSRRRLSETEARLNTPL
jgi:DNA-binding IclR family transcriptional regulator